MKELRDRYLAMFGSRRMALIGFAVDMARSDKETLHLGYSPEAAALAAARVFEATTEERDDIITAMTGRAPELVKGTK